MSPWEIVTQSCAFNRDLWAIVQCADASCDEVMVSRFVRSSLCRENIPIGFERVPFVLCGENADVVEGLRQAVSLVRSDTFNSVWQASKETGTRFARTFWRFWLRLAKREPAICVVLSGLSKEVVEVLGEEDFDYLALEIFLSIYRSRFVVQGTSLGLMSEYRDPIQDALADWVLAEAVNDPKRTAKAQSRFLRWAFSGDSICDLSTSAVVNFQANPQEIEEAFNSWCAIGVGQESTFRLRTFLTGASRAENRRRWRAVEHLRKKQGPFRYPNGVAGEELAGVFEKLMGRGVLLGLSAVDLMRVLPVVAAWAFLSVGLPCDESQIGCMTGSLEKRYRRCFEEIRVRNLSSESLVGSPQRLFDEESLCAIGCG